MVDFDSGYLLSWSDMNTSAATSHRSRQPITGAKMLNAKVNNSRPNQPTEELIDFILNNIRTILFPRLSFSHNSYQEREVVSTTD